MLGAVAGRTDVMTPFFFFFFLSLRCECFTDVFQKWWGDEG